jgi:hypothetical protein
MGRDCAAPRSVPGAVVRTKHKLGRTGPKVNGTSGYKTLGRRKTGRGRAPRRRSHLPEAMALNRRVCSVSATSTGSRSIDEAP